jgi:site-specific recombinase XerD
MADLSLDAEEFLGYLAIEKGRSVNTLLYYRKDITLYE